MKYLLDTHALIWFLDGSPNISSSLQDKISYGECFISIISLWEIAIKMNIGKITFDGGFQQFLDLTQENGFEIAPIRPEYLNELLNLPLHHRDPFDRLIIANAIVEKWILLTADENIHKYDVKWLWS